MKTSEAWLPIAKAFHDGVGPIQKFGLCNAVWKTQGLSIEQMCEMVDSIRIFSQHVIPCYYWSLSDKQSRMWAALFLAEMADDATSPMIRKGK